MKKVYYLSTCDNCRRILKEKDLVGQGYALHDIKTDKITPAELDDLKDRVGSYEALFSRRAIKYKELGLKDKSLTEKDYRRLILEEYTFLKRPVIVDRAEISIGGQVFPAK